MPKLLDLFCGAGGAAMGYRRAGFEVVGVDIEPQPHYPFRFIQGSALNEDDLPAIHAFDAIHASPPCQAYSAVTVDRNGHPDLIARTRELLDEVGLPYVIENVPGAPLENPVQLCGSSFGLPLRRHRLFECSFPAMGMPCAHAALPAKYEHFRHGKTIKTPFVPVYGTGGGKSAEAWPEAMGIDWMTRPEMAEAIPPVFTEHIGGYLIAELKGRVAA